MQSTLAFKCNQITKHMETNGKKRNVSNNVFNVKEVKESHHKENFELNSTSYVTSRFDKKHGRRHYSFGDGHEPGTLPGAGF